MADSGSIREMAKAVEKGMKDADKKNQDELKDLERLHKISMKMRVLEEDPKRMKVIDAQTKSLYGQIKKLKEKIKTKKKVSFKA